MRHKLFIILAAGCMAIGMVSCQKGGAEYETEKYIKVKGRGVSFLSMCCLEGKIEISKWNNDPIDIITRHDLYRHELKSRVQAANQFKYTTLHEDSILLEICKKQMLNATCGKEYFEEQVREAKAQLASDVKLYDDQVKHINTIKELIETPEANTPLYEVYSFEEILTFTHPSLNEKVEQNFYGYSYFDLNTQTVVYVEENNEAVSYTPNYKMLL